MRALVYDGLLRLVDDYPLPQLRPGWALIRVHAAGICKTDMEIMKGYGGFQGVLGHEFVGTVERCDKEGWIGTRVVGDINAACGSCSWCLKGLGRHCPHRVTLGISGLDGSMADYCTLPLENLVEVPRGVSDEEAILMEPLAAACEICEQLTIEKNQRVLVLGDGRLGILCAWVLSTVNPHVILIGRHRDKLDRAAWRTVETTDDSRSVVPGADIVVEATGSEGGLEEAIRLCRPRGTIVLKTTIARPRTVDLTPVVVNEISMVGSRCGRMTEALRIFKAFPDMPLERIITASFPVDQARKAFSEAARSGAMKTIIRFS